MKLLVLALVALTGAARADSTTDYIDRHAKAWIDAPPPIANVACALSCHTTFAYLLARKQDASAPIVAAVEARIPALLAGTAMPYYGKRGSERAKQSLATEAILTAVAVQESGKHGRVAQDAIDAMWKYQRPDGGFDWLDFNIEPWEAGSDWGNIMALAIGNGPQEYSRLATGRGRLLIKYLQGRLADTQHPIKQHDRVTLLWMARTYDLYLTPALTKDQRTALSADVIKTQRPDGGFSLATWLGRTATQSDGYATALGVLALCDGAPGKRRPEVIKALDWLTSHKADNGSYPSPAYGSATARAKGFATDAATAYAVIAIETCKR